MALWYHTESGEELGPIDGSEIRKLLAEGRINASTPVRREGTHDRFPLGTIKEFDVNPYASPLPETSRDIDLSGYSPSGPQIRPLVRFWARMGDLMLFQILLLIPWQFAAPDLITLVDNEAGWMAILFLFFIVDSMILATCGTTPFKALLNVRVRNRDGSRLNHRQALRRSLLVWIMGMGMGLHELTFVAANLFSLFRLGTKGVTPWDARGGFTVTHREIAWWRWMVLVSPVAAGWLWALWLFASRSK